MMKSKLVSRGRHVELPIIGASLIEVRLSTCLLPALVCRSADGGEAELTFEDSITLKRGNQEILLEGSRPGESFDPKRLAPLLELLGSKVKDAIASNEGSLRITFATEWVLEVIPGSGGYEAWHFQYPRPGRPVGGSMGQFVSLTGAQGRLI